MFILVVKDVMFVAGDMVYVFKTYEEAMERAKETEYDWDLYDTRKDRYGCGYLIDYKEHN